jgi:hypothetical protein
MKESVLTETDWNITGSFGQQKYMQKNKRKYSKSTMRFGNKFIISTRGREDGIREVKKQGNNLVTNIQRMYQE